MAPVQLRHSRFCSRHKYLPVWRVWIFHATRNVSAASVLRTRMDRLRPDLRSNRHAGLVSEPMDRFVFNTTPSIRFGWGAVADIAQAPNITPSSKVLIVTDQGIARTDLLSRVRSALEPASVQITIFDDVIADPPEAVVIQSVSVARGSAAGVIVGLGGGSSLDVAKLTALLARSDEKLADLYGVNKVRGARLPLVLIPTTAGTGSEVTPIAVVTTSTSEKKGVSSPVLLPDVALLDPQLTVGLPPHVTASTGIDAIVHSIEAYTSANSNNNPISRALATEALRLLTRAIVTAVTNGSDASARSQMLLGSMLAGQAFANSPVAAVHALAYPLGGHYHLAHGLANALLLPHVLRFNLPACEDAYRDLAVVAFPQLGSRPIDERAVAFVSKLSELCRDCGIPQRLRDVGVEQSRIPSLASDALQQTRLLVNNPRPLDLNHITAIYEAAW